MFYRHDVVTKLSMIAALMAIPDVQLQTGTAPLFASLAKAKRHEESWCRAGWPLGSVSRHSTSASLRRSAVG